MSEFDDAMLLGSPDDTGARSATLTAGWAIGGAINGGVLMALGAKAMGEAVAEAGGASDVLAFSAYFLSASQAGPAQVRPEVVRIGRNFSTAQASILQPTDDGVVERVRLLATVADVSANAEPIHRQPPPPDLPPPDQCLSTADGPRELMEIIKITERLDTRLDPVSAGFGMGQPSQRGELTGWIRFIDGREPDPLSLCFLVDAFPPVSFDLGALGWAPTIEFTGYVRGVPAPGWLRVRLRTSTVTGGLFEEDCVIWDSTDRVVAHSRQLGGVRMPPAPGA